MPAVSLPQLDYAQYLAGLARVEVDMDAIT